MDGSSKNFGVVDNVFYDDSLEALVMFVTGVNATLEDNEVYPQCIVLNGIRYDFHAWVKPSSTSLRAIHYVDLSPLNDDEDYLMKVPFVESLISTDNPTDIQLAGEDNQNTNLKVDTINLNRVKERFLGQVIREAPYYGTPSVRFSFLNQSGHRGALEFGIRDLVGVEASPSSAQRVNLQNISLGAGNWQGATTDGSTLWFVNNTTKRIIAYSATSRNPDTSKDSNTRAGAGFITGLSYFCLLYTSPSPRD